MRGSILSVSCNLSWNSLARWEVLHLRILALQPVLLNELVAVLVQELVCGADGAVGHTSHDTNFLRALWLAK